MLIQKSNIEVGDIIVLKMISGEEVIAKLTHIATTGEYGVEKPYILTATQSGGLGFIPYSMLGQNDKIVINKHSVIFVTSAKDDYEQVYLQQTSGLLISRN